MTDAAAAPPAEAAPDADMDLVPIAAIAYVAPPDGELGEGVGNVPAQWTHKLASEANIKAARFAVGHQYRTGHADASGGGMGVGRLTGGVGTSKGVLIVRGEVPRAVAELVDSGKLDEVSITYHTHPDHKNFDLLEVALLPSNQAAQGKDTMIITRDVDDWYHFAVASDRTSARTIRRFLAAQQKFRNSQETATALCGRRIFAHARDMSDASAAGTAPADGSAADKKKRTAADAAPAEQQQADVEESGAPEPKRTNVPSDAEMSDEVVENAKAAIEWISTKEGLKKFVSLPEEQQISAAAAMLDGLAAISNKRKDADKRAADAAKQLKKLQAELDKGKLDKMFQDAVQKETVGDKFRKELFQNFNKLAAGHSLTEVESNVMPIISGMITAHAAEVKAASGPARDQANSRLIGSRQRYAAATTQMNLQSQAPEDEMDDAIHAGAQAATASAGQHRASGDKFAALARQQMMFRSYGSSFGEN